MSQRKPIRRTKPEASEPPVKLVNFDTTFKPPHTYFIAAFALAKEDRDDGQGTHLFETLVSKLPKYIHYVELDSVKVEERAPTRFWKRLGFKWKYEAEPGEKRSPRMILGVNGHKTPEPIPFPRKPKKRGR